MEGDCTVLYPWQIIFDLSTVAVQSYMCGLAFAGRLISHWLLYVDRTVRMHTTYCVTPVVMELFNLLSMYTPIRKFPTVFQCPLSVWHAVSTDVLFMV